MQEPIISFKDFQFTYKAQKAPTIRGITLDIYPGEKVLIVGPSGSGKSTLGHCINALIPNAFEGKIEGSVSVASLDVATTDIYEVNRHVGTVLQDSDAQFVALTVEEDIAFSLENQCMAQDEMVPLVTKMANIVGMQDFLSQSPQEISGGQKQRVSLAGVLIDDVEILLFDEPLANLDPETGRRAIALIDELHKSTGKTIIIIEHRLEDVLSSPVDRILLLEDGRIVCDTTPERLLSGSLLEDKGIRDPLYLSALRQSGADLSQATGIASIETIGLDPYRTLVRAWYQKRPKVQAAKEQESQLMLSDISFSYDGIREVLSHVSTEIYRGEMVSILGKNGAGKSTLAQILMGINRQDSGTISFEGEEISSLSVTERSSLIGFVMQNPNHMISHSMIYDEVAFALRQRGYSEDDIRPRVMDVLELCGLRAYHAWPISALSFGQKKRVTIASILVTDPKVLILDEPTAGQDYVRYTLLMEFLSSLNKKTGLTILFITHDMHLALEYTDRSLVLSDGLLLADERVCEVFSNRDLLAMANLTVTSLYTLAKRCDIDDIPSFIDCFIQGEKSRRPEGVSVVSLGREKASSPQAKKGQHQKNTIKNTITKKGVRSRQSGRKFGFALSYEDTPSFVHSLNGVTKLVFFMLWIVLCLTTFDLRILIPSMFFAQAALASCKVPMKKFLPYIIAMTSEIVVNAIFIFLFSPDQGQRYLGTSHILLGSPSARYALSVETLFYLLVVCLKYFAIFPMALLFVTATHPSQFSSSLNRIGIRYKTSYAVGLAMRYLPEVTSSYSHILHAQMARGVDISKNVKFKQRVSSVGKILAPLVLSSLDRIDVVTNAMVLRGFGKHPRRTWYLARKMKFSDILVLVLMVCWISLSLYLRFGRAVMFWFPFY
ncbi:MAG: ATP-binding cassette domain-containing protein [Spirochaetia bacterium]|nr:ATP-binding cassette domain-containing protein [Spirochaetia bacterium]